MTFSSGGCTNYLWISSVILLDPFSFHWYPSRKKILQILNHVEATCYCETLFCGAIVTSLRPARIWFYDNARHKVTKLSYHLIVDIIWIESTIKILFAQLWIKTWILELDKNIISSLGNQTKVVNLWKDFNISVEIHRTCPNIFWVLALSKLLLYTPRNQSYVMVWY